MTVFDGRAPRAAVTLNDWYRDFPAHTVGGSLYAVPPQHRMEAASLLHRNGCRLHVDVIIGPDGHRGVGWAELSAVRAALPTARIDLHLVMVDDCVAIEDETLAIDITRTLTLDAITMSGEQIGRHRARLERLRAAGVDVCEEVRPDAAGPTEPDIDGALVMFIPPGTKQAADLAQLDKVSKLAASLPVRVDGGITHPIARQCHDRGAGYLISGRDLLTVTTSARHTPSTDPERRPA
jgi:pentose-5-phosphate-3-epimerase